MREIVDERLPAKIELKKNEIMTEISQKKLLWVKLNQLQLETLYMTKGFLISQVDLLLALVMRKIITFMKNLCLLIELQLLFTKM